MIGAFQLLEYFRPSIGLQALPTWNAGIIHMNAGEFQSQTRGSQVIQNWKSMVLFDESLLDCLRKKILLSKVFVKSLRRKEYLFS
jgi:hypothetical protein